MNFNEQYPASFDNYPRPSKMKRPNVSSIATGAATRFIGYIGDQLESILIDKYGKTRGEKTFEGLLNTGNNAIYTVCTDIIKEKIKMFQDLGIPDSEYMNKDYFDTNYYALWSKWMDEFVKKPYSHLIKKENNSNKEDVLVSFVNHVGEINNTMSGETGEVTEDKKKILCCYWNEWDVINTFANKNNIKLKVLDKFVDGNRDECIEFCEDSTGLNEKINKLKESIEKLSGKKVKLIESNTKKDFERARGLVKIAIKKHFPGLTAEEKTELWDAVLDDYSDSDISEITITDVIEIAEASGVGYAGDDDLDESKLIESNADNISPYDVLFTVTRKKPVSYKELRIESPRSIIEQYAIANFKDPKDFRGMATKIKEYIKSLPIVNLTSHKLPYDDFPSNTPTTPFIGIRKNGNAKQVYFIDPQGYNYAKYILRLN